MSYLDGVAFGSDQISAFNQYDLSESFDCSQTNKEQKVQKDLQKAIHDLEDDYQSERNKRLRQQREIVLREKPETQLQYVSAPSPEGFNNPKKNEEKYLLILLVFVCVICVVQYHQLQNISTQLYVLNQFNTQKT